MLKERSHKILLLFCFYICLMEKKIIEEYVFGNGLVGVGSGYSVERGIIPFIDLCHLEKSFEIDENPKEVTRIVFENLESLEVLQRALDSCRKYYTPTIDD